MAKKITTTINFDDCLSIEYTRGYPSLNICISEPAEEVDEDEEQEDPEDTRSSMQYTFPSRESLDDYIAELTKARETLFEVPRPEKK